uniref:Uncharacterized protein n=1 Tax=Oryza sativa subsp. japonica TaxID=39947 RepID=Q67WY6_ORYSJ|nr:hypothetical protein [Oryza sativa Japonica Group]
MHAERTCSLVVPSRDFSVLRRRRRRAICPWICSKESWGGFARGRTCGEVEAWKEEGMGVSVGQKLIPQDRPPAVGSSIGNSKTTTAGSRPFRRHTDEQ